MLDIPTFYIARYPVTLGQFGAFLIDSGYKIKNCNAVLGVANHPVVLVSWHEAMAYCQWLSAKLRGWEDIPELLKKLLNAGWFITLPSEAEWEKASRGVDKRIYPWGDKFDSEMANIGDTGIGTTSTVGCFPAGASPYGVMEMSGNVWEWTSSKDGFQYPYNPSDGREDLEGDSEPRVLRGGAFNSNASEARCASKNSALPDMTSNNIGFRVVIRPPVGE